MNSPHLNALLGIKEPLLITLHFSVSILIIVSSICGGVFVIITDFDFDSNPFFNHSMGYVGYFFSMWSSASQIIYFHIFSLIDAINLFGKNSINLCKLRNELPNIANYLLFTLVIPTSLTVSTVFWAFYAYDREYIYPRDMDKFYPPWINHVMHTLPVPLSVIYMVLADKEDPPKKHTLSGLTMFLGIYATCIIRLKLQNGVWVYPALNLIPPYLVKYVLTFTAIISYVYLFLGHFLNGKIRGLKMRPEKQTNKIKSH